MKIAIIRCIQIFRGAKRRIRRIWYGLLLKKMGTGCQICDNVLIENPQNISLGCGVSINQYSILQACEKATIILGNRVTISYGAMILTGGIYINNRYNTKIHETGSIVISDNVWVGAKVLIMPGVEVGVGSVLAAGSVVTKNVPSNVLMAGVPAKIVKEI